MIETQKHIVKAANQVDVFLKRLFKKKTTKKSSVWGIKVRIIFGGKKFRSYLIVCSGKIFNLNYRQLIAVGAAVECMHSYSLIHDDLPSMDNDDFRRGKKVPT